MALYVSGFLKYLESGKYADLVLISQHGKFHVHKIILVYSSEFFARLLLGEFRESKQTEIELKYPDPDNVFPTVLKFMYGGNILGLVDYHNVISLLAMADHYLIQELKDYCHQYIENHVTRNSALEMLHKAIELQVHDMIEFYSNLISKAFCNIPNADYTQFSFPIFSKILHHKYLAVRDEYALYKVIMGYISANREDLNDKQIEDLVECIRFRFMTFEQLQECQRNSWVPKHLLLEAIMFRLKTHEVPDKMDSELISNNIRLQKRITCSTFEYKFDFDDRGILHYLATNGGTESWSKLELAKKVAVTSSSIEMGKASDLLNKVPMELWTKDVPASWFTIDFGKSRRVFPTHYTLRHGGNYRADSLRTWDLQGSVDGKSWSVIKRHNQDTSLTDKFATHTWTINLDEHTAYRYFRILQTGRNSSNHNFLVLSGIEFYGDLYEWNDDEDSSSLDIHL